MWIFIPIILADLVRWPLSNCATAVISLVL
jgi:hypothetical protein